MSDAKVQITENKAWFEKKLQQIRALSHSQRNIMNMWGNDAVSNEDLKTMEKAINLIYSQIDCTIQGHPDAINVGDNDHNVMRCPVCDDGEGEVEIL